MDPLFAPVISPDSGGRPPPLPLVHPDTIHVRVCWVWVICPQKVWAFVPVCPTRSSSGTRGSYLRGLPRCLYSPRIREGWSSRILKLAKRLDYSPPLSCARLCGVCSCSTTSSRRCNRPTSSSSMVRCLILARLTARARIARAPIATAPAALAPTAKAPRLVHPSPVATRANATCLPNGGCSTCLAFRFLTVLSFPRFSSVA